MDLFKNIKVVFDIEANGLLTDVTKIHCLSYKFENSTEIKSLTTQESIKKFFLRDDIVFVGHNIINYDLPVVEKLLGVKVPYKRCIDTLSLSWYLFEDRILHGLESWGSDVGFEKVKVEDSQWEEGDINLMIKRCEGDVFINSGVWEIEKKILNKLYSNKSDINKLISYLSFKMDCVREQESIGLRLDTERVKKALEELYSLKEDRVKILFEAMPKEEIISKKIKPTTIYKKDGTLSSKGKEWFDFLRERGISEDYEGVVEYVSGYKEPNPNSNVQIKNWLFSNGWIPQHIKYRRDKKKNTVTKIPQITSKEDPSCICPSVKALMDKLPELSALDGLTIISHRIGVLEGLLKNCINGRIYASASSITSTMRLKHKVFVNLPAISAPFAGDIRSSIIADNNCVLIGADLSSIEDKTKRHYLYDYDPEYVKELEDPNYSPHTDIAVLAGLMTREEESFYKRYDKEENKSIFSDSEKEMFKRLKIQRHKGKTCNFSATYGIGVEALGRALNVPVKEAKKVLDAYWKKNWSIKVYEENCEVKEVNGSKWILNKVSGFWLPLRKDKDRLSATNQSTAVYVFDLWLGIIRNHGIKIAAQYHDEILLNCPKHKLEEFTKIIKDSMVKVNNILKLNVTLGCSVEVGYDYGSCH